MVWASPAQLSSCQWGYLRCFLQCRYVVKRDVPNTAVTGRKGVRLPQGTCSSSGNGAGSCVVVNKSHENRISLLRFLFCHIPFQQISAALLAVHPKGAQDSWVLSRAFFFLHCCYPVSVGINPQLHQSFLDMKRVGSCPSVQDASMMTGILGRRIIKKIKPNLSGQKSRDRQPVTSDVKTVLGHRFLEASSIWKLDILGNQQFQYPNS